MLLAYKISKKSEDVRIIMELKDFCFDLREY